MNPLFCAPKSVWLSVLGKIAVISLSPNVILFDETLTSDKSFNDVAPDVIAAHDNVLTPFVFKK